MERNQKNELIMDGRTLKIDGEKSLLDLARKNDIDIPSICYHPNLSVYGGCRLCIVEIEGMGIVTSCSTAPRAGMIVQTQSKEIREMRRVALELILANHDNECTTCPRSDNCRLQELARRINVKKINFPMVRKSLGRDLSSPALVRDPDKCILCGNCIRACDEIQGIGVLDFVGRGHDVVVAPALGKPLGDDTVNCVNCGQCASVCPVGSLYPKSAVNKVWDLLNDPSKTVVAQIAPAVRVAIGETFGYSAGEVTRGQMIMAMRRLGFDKVYDTTFGADFTTTEEAEEIIERVTKNRLLPLFTSCCPAWVKYAEQFYPEILPHLSTCKSPQMMLAAVHREALPTLLGVKAENIIHVSIMPCTAKKYEIEREEFSRNGIPDIDYSITTIELGRMIRDAGINFRKLPESEMDDPFGAESGSGVIFGTSGGVTEAVLRYASEKLLGDKKGKEKVVFSEVRGEGGLRESTCEIGEVKLNLCQVHGLANVKTVIESIKAGTCDYHVIEVMACPKGCINGGGQPITFNPVETINDRVSGIYQHDVDLELKTPQDNIGVQRAYDRWLGPVGGHVAHELLHTHFYNRKNNR